MLFNYNGVVGKQSSVKVIIQFWELPINLPLSAQTEGWEGQGPLLRSLGDPNCVLNEWNIGEIAE